MGGEKYNWNDSNRGPSGSPPHGRGKAVLTAARILLQGITPAWAGKRQASRRSSMASRDHPRMGGEKVENLLNC